MLRRGAAVAIVVGMALVVLIPLPAPAPPPGWDAKAPMSTPRGGFGVAALNGKIYVAGGLQRSGFDLNLTDSLEVYDPASDSWSPLAPLPAPRWGHVLVAARGKLFMAGGSTDVFASQGMTTDVELYDPGLDRWSPVAPMPEARIWAAGFAISETVQVWGGSPDGGSSAVATRFSYDPQTNGWTVGQPMPFSRENSPAVVIGTSVYLTGGWRNLPNATEYRTSTQLWRDRAQMLRGRGAHAAADLDGNVYVIAGVTADTTECAPAASVEVYSPATDAWSTFADYPQAAWALGAVRIGQLLYAMGGSDCGASFTSVYSIGSPLTPGSGGPIGFPWALVAVIVVVAVLVAAALGVLWRRRRKAQPPAA